MSNEVYHYAVAGDQLFGCSEWACGKAKEGEMAYFGEAGTMLKVNCHKCLNSKAYRDDLKEFYPEAEHPFTTRSKKAHATMKAKKEAHESYLKRLAETISKLSHDDRMTLRRLVRKAVVE